jgi:hypothetical protein
MTGTSQPFSLNPTGTLSRRHLAQFVSAIDNDTTANSKKLLAATNAEGPRPLHW